MILYFYTFLKILELQTRNLDLADKRKKDLELHIKSGAPIKHKRDCYIVIDVERSIWGIVQIWFFACVAALAVLAATVFMAQSSGGANQGAVVGLIASAACVAGGMVATHVYRQNYFVVSNERVFARIQFSPFARRSQNVELEHVEDCSIRQAGIVQTLLNYGSIRLSTVGDEHTYRFTFVSRPEEQFSIINKVVQAVDEGESTRYL